MKTRREFIRQASFGSCILIAGSLIPILGNDLTYSSLTLDNDENELKIPLKSFNENSYHIIKHKKFKSILISKDKDGDFHAVQLICPHKRGKIKTTEEGLKCKLHGSTFTMEGEVTKGPAKSNLTEFPISIVGEYILVSLDI